MQFDVKIRKVIENGKPLKAVASVTVDGAFVIHNVRVIETENAKFVAMPYATYQDAEGKDANSADDVFATLDGSKVAVSVTIDTFAAGLSGKLQNGDIISLIVVDKNAGTSSIPGELKYMKVITTTTAGGIDQDSIVKNEDGSFEIPSTITVLCNTEQAKLLAKYEADITLQAALVYRGDTETANKFIEKQDAFFAGGGNNG